MNQQQKAQIIRGKMKLCFFFLVLLQTAYAKIEWKPGTDKNRLFPEYGTNFRYIGELKHNLDRVTVVTSIPIPKFGDLQIVPIQFRNCSLDYFGSQATRWDPDLVENLRNWCTQTNSFVDHLKKKETYYLGRLKSLLETELYAALPELKPHVDLESARKKRGLSVVLSALPGLITLAVESISSFLKHKQERQISDAVKTLRKDQGLVRNKLQQHSQDFLMYGRYNIETLEEIIKTVNSLHERQTDLEQYFTQKHYGQLRATLDWVSFSFNLHMYMKLTEEEHVNQYQLLEVAGKELLQGIATLGQGYLPQELFPDDRLQSILEEVREMMRAKYPDYVLAADHISHYRDMKLVTFAVDKESHSLIVSFPVFVKDYQRAPLSIYEIESVHVPIKDKNKHADSYSKIQITKPYIAVGQDYYIQLRMTELIMCKSIRHTYYCEELFVFKHKSKHSCASAIFYHLSHKLVAQNCAFDYFYNITTPPVILDGGKKLLLANFDGPRSLECNGGLAKPLPAHTYAVVHRDFLCNCHLDMEHATLLQQLSACDRNKTHEISMKFVVNMGFYQLLHLFQPKLVQHIKPRMHNKEQTFPLRLVKGPSGAFERIKNLKDLVQKLDTDGQLSNPKSSSSKYLIQDIVPKSYSYIISIMSGSVAIIMLIGIIFLALKYKKLKVLVSSLALHVVPTIEAKALHTQDKVICTDPQLTTLASVLTVLGILFWLYRQCRSLTWLRGYKYSRCSTLYVFLFNHHFYVPVKVRRLTGHMNMYKLENPIGPDSLSYSKTCLWDTLHFDWQDTSLYLNSQLISLPPSVTLPLKDKIRARRMIQQGDLDLQFMIKQGTNWYSLHRSTVISSPTV